ncbi:unnamed protein product [Schistocephalus solidus]|uniref:Uncharacterized protein n=1 Tax=Schistocephalus solidus TaxID=70667 RepID=A0A183SNT5_SCHSO|nr:unnamed protein product [Schistocephalus solidus]
MAGVSGRYDAPSMFPYNARKQRPRNIITDNRVYDGDPLAFVLYLERPYIRLVILRLTDLTIRLYLQHALGLYDRPWYGWHRVSVRTGSQKKLINYRTRKAQVQTEIIFKFDHKEARRQLRPEDMLWPLWADLRKQAVEEANMFFAADLREITHSVLLNEIFFGLPPEECLSRYAVDRFIKKHSEFKETFEATAYGVFHGRRGEFREVTSFYPFSGSIRNIALGSGCHCHGEAFGPRFIQLGSDVRWTWLCDARTIPESLLQKQTSMITPPCRSDETTQPCACASRSGRAVCLCPTTAKCKKLPDSLIWSLPNSEDIFLDSMRSAASLKTDLRMVQTMRRLAYDVVEPVQLDTPVSSTIFTNTAREIVIGQDTALGKNTGVVLAENEEFWKQSDSCFTNIFTCRHGRHLNGFNICVL